MPTYDYRCAACGHEFENFQSINQPALRKCPKCGKPKLERLIGSGAGILFKGGGFYQTDYRSENYQRGEKSEKEGGKSEAKSSDAPSAPAKDDAKAPKSPKDPKESGASKRKPEAD